MTFNKLLLGFILSGIGVAHVSANSQWITVETVIYDWNGDGKPDQFILEKPSFAQIDAEVHFTRLRIKLSGHGQFVFDYKAGWINFGDDPVIKSSMLVKRNLVKSGAIAILSPMSSKPVLPTVFLVDLEKYPNTPFGLFALQLNKTGKPYYAFKSGGFYLEAFEDLNGDGFIDIAGKPWLTEVFGNHFETYSPYHVYTMKNNRKGKMQFSLSMSKRYNLEHYYGWAGPDYSVEMVVITRPKVGDKPIIVKVEDAYKLSK